MKRNRYKGGKLFYSTIWTAIALTSMYLLFRFVSISISGDIGQATENMKATLMTKLCANIMESGSSFVEFQLKGDEEAYPFLVKNTIGSFAIHKYAVENSQEIDLYKDEIQLTSEMNSHEIIDNLKMDTSGIDNNAKMDTSEILHDSKINTSEIINNSYEYLTEEYFLTNGALFHSKDTAQVISVPSKEGEANESPKLEIGFLQGGIYREIMEKDNASSEEDQAVETMAGTLKTSNGTSFTLAQLDDVNFLVRNFYIIDEDTEISEKLFNAKKLLAKDMKLKQSNDAPQILIYHTHSQESYINSRANNVEDTVVGVGSYLTKILEDDYGYDVIHDKSCYDIVDGVLDRNVAYNVADDSIEKILEENPSIEVIIDLHRDGAPKRATTINGEETAQIMLFNGLSRNLNGPITYLDNPNLENNLAFSLQLQIKSLEMYPGLFYKNYLHCYRYNMHLRAKSLLVELGTDYNTLQSAKNAMEPFAEILDAVLKGE